MAPRLTPLLLIGTCVLALAVQQGLGSEYLDVLKAEACPLSVPGCLPDINECVACDLTCSSCQRVSSNRKNLNYQSCGPEDCMTCASNLVHVPLFNDNTGRCSSEEEVFRNTCPESVAGCLKENNCKECHHSCLACQGETDVCSKKDCMSCRDGLVLWPIYSDGTGECLPPGAHVEQHELTCPEDTPGCHMDNRCVQCPATCDTCQDVESRTGICSEDMCVTCHENHKLVPVHEDGRGYCKFEKEPSLLLKEHESMPVSVEKKDTDTAASSGAETQTTPTVSKPSPWSSTMYLFIAVLVMAFVFWVMPRLRTRRVRKN